ncbi:type II secretion system F family protein [Verrucomicrobiota bacterium]
MDTYLLLIPFLFMISITGAAFILLTALFSGAEIYESAYTERTSRQLEEMFFFIPAKRIATAAWAAASVSFIVVFMFTGSLISSRGIIIGLMLSTFAGILVLLSPRPILKIMRQRRLTRFNNQLVNTLVSMSNALKAGFSISQAFESVVQEGENPIAQEFDVFLHQTRIGVNFSEALKNLDDRVGSNDLTLLIQSIEVARNTGGNLTEIFERISATIRERMRIENKIKSMTAQGRLQGIVVGCMPIVIAAFMTIVDPEMMHDFFHSMSGIIVLVIITVLILLGALTIRKIINIDV